jgi:hypothetical protein
MMKPLVPPVADKAALGKAPALTQVTVLSVVVTPGVVLQVGAAPPEVPATVAISTLPLLSRMRARRA